MVDFEVEGKLENTEKNPRSKGTTNNKLNPHMTLGLGIEPWPHWWKAPSVLFPEIPCTIHEES